MNKTRNFLDLDRFDYATLRRIIDQSKAMKAGHCQLPPRPLDGKILAMIFEKPSTRTRVSFEASILQLGGHPIVMTRTDTQLGRGETIADTARVLSRYVDAIMLRTDSEHKLYELAEHATVPVINGLTDRSHPCQVMADIQTFEEHRGTLSKKIVAWCGDGNNVANSWIHASALFGFTLRLACPERLRPSAEIIDNARKMGAKIEVSSSPQAAIAGSHCVMTDTWLSMGCKDTDRHELLAPYQINKQLMKLAADDAIFMHCLPAHRGEEVTDDVIDSDQSLVWDEAENRLHVQKSILTWCLL